MLTVVVVVLVVLMALLLLFWLLWLCWCRRCCCPHDVLHFFSRAVLFPVRHPLRPTPRGGRGGHKRSSIAHQLETRGVSTPVASSHFPVFVVVPYHMVGHETQPHFFHQRKLSPPASPPPPRKYFLTVNDFDCPCSTLFSSPTPAHRTLQPVTTAILSVVFLHTTLRGHEIFGGVVRKERAREKAKGRCKWRRGGGGSKGDHDDDGDNVMFLLV